MARFAPLSCSVFTVCLLAGVSTSPAEAQDLKVWVDCLHGASFGCPYEPELQDFGDALYEAGASEVVISTELPLDVSDGSFQLLVIILPFLPFDEATLKLTIPGFLSMGGRLVLLADNNSMLQSNNHITEVLESIPGHDLSLNGVSANNDCGGSTSQFPDDPLTAGLSRWYWTDSNTVSGGDPLIQFDPGDGSTASLASVARLPFGGEIILFGDIEGFVMNCSTANPADNWASDHGPFWRNLLSSGTSPTDNDGDGYDSKVDCNDDDPFVHPGASEDCDNGLDDNCNGLVDGEDPACNGDDDDMGSDDDDTGGDDDDTGDDDDSAGDDVGRSIRARGACACDTSDSSADGPGAGLGLALLLIGGLRRTAYRSDKKHCF